MLPLVKKLRNFTDLPVFLQPNSGEPTLVDETLVYPEHQKDFGDFVASLKELKVYAVGGCCGITPKHIKKGREAIDCENNSKTY